MKKWVDIKGFEGLYQFDCYGNIKSLITDKLLAQSKSKVYLSVVLYKNGVRYYKAPHRLVAQQFVPNPENKPEVNHLDGNKHNNHYSNLEWATKEEQQQHAIKLGLVKHHIRTDSFASILVLDTRTGVFYDSITQAAKYNGRTQQNLCRTFKGGRAKNYYLQIV